MPSITILSCLLFLSGYQSKSLENVEIGLIVYGRGLERDFLVNTTLPVDNITAISYIFQDESQNMIASQTLKKNIFTVQFPRSGSYEIGITLHTPGKDFTATGFLKFDITTTLTHQGWKINFETPKFHNTTTKYLAIVKDKQTNQTLVNQTFLDAPFYFNVTNNSCLDSCTAYVFPIFNKFNKSINASKDMLWPYLFKSVKTDAEPKTIYIMEEYKFYYSRKNMDISELKKQLRTKNYANIDKAIIPQPYNSTTMQMNIYKPKQNITKYFKVSYTYQEADFYYMMQMANESIGNPLPYEPPYIEYHTPTVNPDISEPSTIIESVEEAVETTGEEVVNMEQVLKNSS